MLARSFCVKQLLGAIPIIIINYRSSRPLPRGGLGGATGETVSPVVTVFCPLRELVTSQAIPLKKEFLKGRA
eukprot:6790198-Pyramimonas_sp.AAC.2